MYSKFFAPLASGESPEKLPLRRAPRVCTLHIEPDQMAAMMNRCGSKFHTMLGIAMGAGATSYRGCDIYNVGDDELLIRNYPDDVVSKPLTASVKLLFDGSIRYENVKEQ